VLRRGKPGQREPLLECNKLPLRVGFYILDAESKGSAQEGTAGRGRFPGSGQRVAPRMLVIRLQNNYNKLQ